MDYQNKNITAIEQIINLQYKPVKVTTNVKHNDEILAYYGYLNAYDPVTGSTILSHLNLTGITRSVLIPGKRIQSITADSEVNRQEFIHQSTNAKLSIEIERNQKLKLHAHNAKQHETFDNGFQEYKSAEQIFNWLELNKLPVSLEKNTNTILVSDCIKIRPPYRNDCDYSCPTGIVLSRIKKIVDRMPS